MPGSTGLLVRHRSSSARNKLIQIKPSKLMCTKQSSKKQLRKQSEDQLKLRSTKFTKLFRKKMGLQFISHTIPFPPYSEPVWPILNMSNKPAYWGLASAFWYKRVLDLPVNSNKPPWFGLALGSLFAGF